MSGSAYLGALMFGRNRMGETGEAAPNFPIYAPRDPSRYWLEYLDPDSGATVRQALPPSLKLTRFTVGTPAAQLYRTGSSWRVQGDGVAQPDFMRVVGVMVDEGYEGGVVVPYSTLRAQAEALKVAVRYASAIVRVTDIENGFYLKVPLQGGEVNLSPRTHLMLDVTLSLYPKDYTWTGGQRGEYIQDATGGPSPASFVRSDFNDDFSADFGHGY